MPSDVTVLVIEDDEALQHRLQQTLRPRYTVLTATCWTEARKIHARTAVDVVVADANLTSRNGTDLDLLCADKGETPVVLVATPARAGQPDARSDARPPLVAFPARPVEFRELPGTLDDVIASRRAGRQPASRPPVLDELNGILAQSEAMRGVMRLIDRAASCDTPILLVGESGTGKELLARALHRKSPRAPGPFLAVNCSAIPEPLLESELFGYRRGAFTDARADQPGLFLSAHRGTIFLDEIGDMATALQGKLLRVLQEKEVHPLGAPAPVPTDVRIVTATHRDLPALVAEGRFREDLLYRINVIEVRVPPLRERPDDLEPLVEPFAWQARREDRQGALCAIRRGDGRDSAAPLAGERAGTGERDRARARARGRFARHTGRSSRQPQGPAVTPGHAGGRRLADVERDHIVHTLHEVAGNKAAAARVLGLNRKTLYRKLTQHRIPSR